MIIVNIKQMWNFSSQIKVSLNIARVKQESCKNAKSGNLQCSGDEGRRLVAGHVRHGAAR